MVHLRRSADPVDPVDPVDLATLVRGLVWRSAPVAEIDVDLRNDRLLVCCLPGLPDVELDVGPALSAGFVRVGDDRLLTTLCLLGLPGWGAAQPTREVRLARTLLGTSIGRAVRPDIEGVTTIGLSVTAVAGLVRVWNRFISG